jgi:uncharacterized protein (DUF305 family)
MNMSGMKMDMENKKSSHMMQMPDGSVMPMSNESMDMGEMTMNDMVKMMDGKTGKGLEKEFVTGMMPHHQGAVDMAKKLLQDNTISTEMKKFAEDIIKAQESEIKMMKGWLETKYK